MAVSVVAANFQDDGAGILKFLTKVTSSAKTVMTPVSSIAMLLAIWRGPLGSLGLLE